MSRKVDVMGTEIVGVTADSRAVKPGFLFAALPGVKADGRDFIGEAVARGASAVLAPEGTVWPVGVPVRRLVVDAEPRRRLAMLAVDLAGAMPRHIAAVTGTNGKTSTVDFLRQILVRAGRKAASVGTLGVVAEGWIVRETLTTPDAVTLAYELAELAAGGTTHVALEASSHGLEQCRLDGLRIEVGAFTNLTRDHLDYHGSVGGYRAAKMRLFERVLAAGGVAVAMADLEKEALAGLRGVAVRRRLDLRLVGVAESRPVAGGQEVVADVAGDRLRAFLPLVGRFQADNAILAVGMAEAMGVRDAGAHLKHLAGVRGRLERAAVLGNGAAAYVDYAHTPDAIERVLAAVRPHAAGRVVIVLGAGGDRDAGKRVLMGAAAARGADGVVVTDDNPRGEDAAAIRAGVLAGCPGGVEIGDRRAAIAAGLAMLRAGDVLVVAGKGHEQGQIVGGMVLPFDDVAVIRELVG